MAERGRDVPDGARGARPLTAQVIGTPRLDLLPLRVGHAEEMAAVLSDPALGTFIGGAPPTAQALHERYRRMTAGSPDPAVSWLNWVIHLRDASCLTGTVQATVGPADDGPADDGLTAEVAWVVGTPWQGRGIAGEAARALVGWLGRRQVDTVIAHIHDDHRASAAVATAAGLAPTGERHDGETRWRRSLRTEHGDCGPPVSVT
jgi:RimJ/RimL family protein N-acetyltransferase